MIERWANLERVKMVASQIPIDAPKEDMEIEIFGNNFGLLFIGLSLQRRIERGLLPAEELSERGHMAHRVTRAEELGERWVRFKEVNELILEKIEDLLEDKMAYQCVFNQFTSLMAERKLDEAVQLDQAVHPTHGMHAAYVVINQRLNPLLETAADGMNMVGIDSTSFFR